MDNTAHRDITDRHETAGQRGELDGRTSTTEQLPVNEVEFGSGWYHDVAIQESEQPVQRKH